MLGSKNTCHDSRRGALRELMEHSATILNNLWRAPSKAAELVRVGLLGALLATLAACGEATR